jgi:photosystem II stability/assembly factor-like uncharacterized protein
MFRTIAFIVLLLGCPDLVLAAGRRRAVPPAESFPPCAMVTGTAAVTFTRDEGRTLAPTAERLSGIAYTFGVVALDEKNKLLAWHQDDLLVSTDAGCSWRVVATIPGADFPPTLSAAKGGRAYAWSDNRRFLVRYDSRGAVKLKEPAAFVGVGINPDNADHLRAGSDEGTVWESRDAGETWSSIGVLRADTSPAIFYRFAFAPSNIDHVVAGTTQSGGYVSRDGGRTWTKSALGTGSVNAFNFVFAPSDDRVVWAMALDANGRHIFRSTDGGATYSAVVDQSPDVSLRNGPVMAAHPTDANVLYFVFGTYFQGYGTDIYRYDAASQTVTTTHNSYDDVDVIAFSPADPRVMYLGLESERQ